MIYYQADGKCALCGKRIKFDDMTLDHIKPLAMGGIDAVENIQCACCACNRAKADFLPDDFIDKITEIFCIKCHRNTESDSSGRLYINY